MWGDFNPINLSRAFCEIPTGVSLEGLAIPVAGTRLVKLLRLTGALRVSSIFVIYAGLIFAIHCERNVRLSFAICLFLFRPVVHKGLCCMYISFAFGVSCCGCWCCSSLQWHGIGNWQLCQDGQRVSLQRFSGFAGDDMGRSKHCYIFWVVKDVRNGS